MIFLAGAMSYFKQSMRRQAFKMKLKPGYEMEYQKRHDEIFPELHEFLLECGVLDYSIFLDQESLTLFAYQVVSDDFDDSKIPTHPIVKRWWAFMADIMDTHPDNAPVSIPLQEVFHMEK